MKITLNNILNRINQALNYPAIGFIDVSHFFDTAIADLNSSLHISIKPISILIQEYRAYEEEKRQGITVSILDVNEEIPLNDTSARYYYDEEMHEYVITHPSADATRTDILYGVFYNNSTGDSVHYMAHDDGTGRKRWYKDLSIDPYEINMLEYLPADWIILWLIPYVCFKYATRDGGIATTFTEEYSQGFMQLQNAYDVPEKTLLSHVADKIAYKEDVKQHLPLLNIKIPTRAIYECMKHDRNVQAKYGSMYDRNGWRNDNNDGGWWI